MITYGKQLFAVNMVLNLSKGWFPLSRNFFVDSRNFNVWTRVNKIEAMYERTRLNVKLERGSTFTFTRDLPYIVSILFTRVKLTCVRAENLNIRK